MYKPKTRVSVHDAIASHRLTIQLQFCTVLYVMLLLIIMLRGSLDFVGLTLYSVPFSQCVRPHSQNNSQNNCQNRI